MFNNNVFYSPHSTPCIYERDDRGVGGVCKKAMRDLNSIKKDLLEAVQAEIESAVSQRNFHAARAAASKIARVVYNDTEKAHFAFGNGDETACIARWHKKFKLLDERTRSARSLCGLFSK